MMIGEKVLLHPEGKSTFTVLSVEEEDALVESVLDAPGKFPFRVPVKFLVPADS